MQDDIRNKLENLSLPDTSSINAPQDLKFTLLSANKSAAMGAWLIAVPAYFLFCVFMKYYFHVNLHIFDIIIETMSDFDKNSGIKFLSALLLVGFPLLCIVLNVLAIVHFRFSNAKRELILTIKLKWINIVLIVICSILVCIFLTYTIIQNAH